MIEVIVKKIEPARTFGDLEKFDLFRRWDSLSVYIRLSGEVGQLQTGKAIELDTGKVREFMAEDKVDAVIEATWFAVPSLKKKRKWILA